MSTWASDRYKILEQEEILRTLQLPNGWQCWMLDEQHNAVATTDMLTWMAWCMDSPNRIVKQEEVGEARVSTVLLMNMGRQPTFETMIFRGGNGDESWQCRTWDEAVAQHEEVVRSLREGAL